MSAGSDPGESSRRGSAAVGIVLIVLGGLFLAERAFDVDIGRYGWPLFVIVPGLLLVGASLVTGGREASGLAVAGGITTTVGLILAVQNATDQWATWAYAWALAGPGGTGLGLVLFGLVRHHADFVSSGLRSLGAGLGLFAAFGLFFEGVIGLSGEPFLIGSDILPIALITLGVALVGLGLLRGRSGGAAAG
ncbi:MAG TPA: DUF5668 domain-containing protein [Candidatus Limnocylindrales bacterium]|jgi:hypothetical protein|nr:DUF5668 domain-containing protein [Candidatus Limnocylindrales bacterium]